MMSWIKLDDQWMDHPKIIQAGRDARDMWLASITWCAKHLTDGYFSANLLPSLAVAAGVDVANCQDFARILLEVRLWDATDNGYMVHDYLDYNPSKEQAIETREARKQAGSAGGKAKASKIVANSLAKSWQKSAPSPSPSPSPSPEPVPNPEQNTELRPLLFSMYEREIGIISPRIRDELLLAEKEYPLEWFIDGFKEAADHNARSWKYVLTILKRWKIDGRSSNGHEVKKEKQPAGHWSVINGQQMFIPEGVDEPRTD